MRPGIPTLLLALLTTFCSPGSDVEHRGRYAFLPGPGINDTPPRPLKHLLIVEQDALSENTLLYYFTGELGAAGLGFEDLRRVALGHGVFQMRFNLPLENYARAARNVQVSNSAAGGAAGAGGAPGDDLGFVPAKDEPLLATIDEHTVPLWQLDSASLSTVGASRYLAALDTTDFTVDAFVGSLNTAGPFSQVRINTGTLTLSHAFELAPMDLTVKREDELLQATPTQLEGVDYLDVELLQQITRISDEATIEASVHVSLSPQMTYAVSNALLTDAFGQGCWSRQTPLWLRFTQVARSYQNLEDNDFAVIQNGQAISEVEDELWVDALGDPQPAAYCSLYE